MGYIGKHRSCAVNSYNNNHKSLAMKILKFGILFLTIIAFLVSCQKSEDQDEMSLGFGVKKAAINENECGLTDSTILWAGQHINVGWVKVVLDGDSLRITYRVNDDWIIKETHLSVKSTFAEIPKNKPGNPQVGLFEFKKEHNPYVSQYSYAVYIDGLEYVYIAAHAVVLSKAGEVCSETLAELEARLPKDPVNVSFERNLVKSYYDLTLSDAGDFSGKYLAWCVDNNNRDINYDAAKLVSSYSTTYNLGSVVPNPANLDLLNYLMNVHYPAKSFPVIQAAIWRIMNGFYWFNGSGGIYLDQNQKNEYYAVIDDVFKNGEGFVPKCDQWVVILVDSGDKLAYQNVFFLVKRKSIPFYDGDETAWGAGSTFTNSNWAMYFEYCIADNPK